MIYSAVILGMFPVLERRSIAGYVTECKGGNSRKEQVLYIQDFTTHFVIDYIV